jgi:hypothetical protein
MKNNSTISRYWLCKCVNTGFWAVDLWLSITRDVLVLQQCFLCQLIAKSVNYRWEPQVMISKALLLALLAWEQNGEDVIVVVTSAGSWVLFWFKMEMKWKFQSWLMMSSVLSGLGSVQALFTATAACDAGFSLIKTHKTAKMTCWTWRRW